LVVESIPELTLRRLPRYHQVLRQLRETGLEMVSASTLAEHLDIHPTQIRKDLAMTGSQGRPKVGHKVDELLACIEAFLHWNNPSEAFLVGAGDLGSALMGFQGLKQTGVSIVAAFDIHPRRIGTKIHDIPVLPMEKFADLARRMHVVIGILCVPERAAQDTADLMIQSGVEAIWNLTFTSLALPSSVLVENVELSSSLSVLVRKLAERRSRKG
jgi:redox-sensing transcriptional repressor